MTPEEALDERLSLADAFVAGVPAQIQRILTTYQGLLQGWAQDNSDLSLPELLAAVQVEDLMPIFKRAGLAKLLDVELPALVQRTVPLIRAELASQGLEGGLDVGAMQVLLDGRAKLLADKLSREAGEAVLNAWVDSTFVGKDLVTATAEAVTSVSGKLASLAQAEIATAIAAIDRLVVVQAGMQRGSAFMYIHPRDAVTRPCCNTIIGLVFTQEEIAAMDNNQLPDVLLTCGGYNCRGSWSPYLLPVKGAAVRGTAEDVLRFNEAATRKNRGR